MLTPRQKDQIKGLIFGQAIGDALGLGAEFMRKVEVKEYYPNGLYDYSQIIQDTHRKRWKKGEWTDDTDQFFCILDSILSTGSVDAIAFADRLYRWYKGTPRGIGQTVLKVVKLPQFTEYPHKAAEIVWKMSGKRNASNGAIMRTSIIGAWNFELPETVALNAESVCKVTHADPRCIGSCVVLSLLIASVGFPIIRPVIS